MKNKILPYIIVLAIGGLATFATFIIWNSFHKEQWLLVISIVSIFYFFLGIIAGILKVEKVWLGWLALHAATLFSFIPGILQFIFSGHFNEARPLFLFMAGLTFVPMAFSFPAIYFTNKYQEDKLASDETPTWLAIVRKGVIGLISLLFPVVLGFFGMFGVMIAQFLAYQLHLQLPIQFIAYPLIFAFLAVVLVYFRNQWLIDSLFVCFFPVFYWCGVQLWNHPEKLTWWDFDNASFQMILTTLMTLSTTFLAGYLANRWRWKGRKAAPTD